MSLGVNEVEKKQCKVCDKYKHLADFPKRKESKDGTRNECNSCKSTYNLGRRDLLSNGVQKDRACSVCGKYKRQA